MKKYLIGIFVMLVIMLPVASKALVHNTFHNNKDNTLCIKNAISHPITPSIISDGLFLDVDDDDDDVFDAEHPTNMDDVVLVNQFSTHHLTNDKFIIKLNNLNIPMERITNPLYILWSVFRI